MTRKEALKELWFRMNPLEDGMRLAFACYISFDDLEDLTKPLDREFYNIFTKKCLELRIHLDKQLRELEEEISALCAR